MRQQHLIHPFQETVPNFQVAQLESRRQQAQRTASLKLKAKWKPPTITTVGDRDAQSNGSELKQTFAPETYNYLPEKISERKESIVKIEELTVDSANAYKKKYSNALPENTINEENKDLKVGCRSALSIEPRTTSEPVLQDVIPKVDIVSDINGQRAPQKATSRPQDITISVDKPLPIVKLPAASGESRPANVKLAKFRYPRALKTDESVSDDSEHQDNIAVVEEELSGLQVEDSLAKRNIQLGPLNQLGDQDMDTTMDEVLPIVADAQPQSHHSEIDPTAIIEGIEGRKLYDHMEGDSDAQNSAAIYNKNVSTNVEDQEMNAGQKRLAMDEKNEEPVGVFDVL